MSKNYKTYKPTSIFKLMVFSLLLPLLISACGLPSGGLFRQSETMDPNKLYDVLWVLVAYGNDESQSVVDPDLQITVTMQEDGSIFGKSGCNNYTGGFQASSDGTFTINQPLASTLMACDRFMEEEAVFLSALQNAESFRFTTEGNLEIHYVEDSRGFSKMIFKNGQASLIDTTWVLKTIGNTQTGEEIPPYNVMTLQFSEDGVMSGSGSCNNFSAEFSVTDGELVIGEIASTARACLDGMELETAYFQALNQVDGYVIQGNTLDLLDQQGERILQFSSETLSLIGTSWALVRMNGEILQDNIEVTAELIPEEDDDNGFIVGNSGCNNFRAVYVKETDQLTIEAPASTKMMCEEGMDIETQFLSIIEGTLTYELIGNRLLLVSENGSLLFFGQSTP